jgi:GTPase involved in cell partitioning and DNA repair
VTDYKTIRKELTAYSKDLADKDEVVILTKTDVLDKKGVAEAKKKIAKYNKNILTVSILDDESLKKLRDDLIKILRSKSK